MNDNNGETTEWTATNLDIVFECPTCVMQYPWSIIKWVMNSRVFWTKGQSMDNMANIDMAWPIKNLHAPDE